MDDDDREENDFVCSWVTVKIGVIIFYGTVIRCDIGVRNTKRWTIMYDGGDEKTITLPQFREQQRLYAKEQVNDPRPNKEQPATRPEPPSKPPSTTKKINTKQRRCP